MRITSVRDQYCTFRYADLVGPSSSPGIPSAPAGMAPSLQPGPPTTTSIPREKFDQILAPKGVTYDQHLDNLESHYNAATEEQ